MKFLVNPAKAVNFNVAVTNYSNYCMLYGCDTLCPTYNPVCAPYKIV